LKKRTRPARRRKGDKIVGEGIRFFASKAVGAEYLSRPRDVGVVEKTRQERVKQDTGRDPGGGYKKKKEGPVLAEPLRFRLHKKEAGRKGRKSVKETVCSDRSDVRTMYRDG